MTGNNVQRLKGGGNKGVIVGFFEVNSLALLSLSIFRTLLLLRVLFVQLGQEIRFPGPS